MAIKPTPTNSKKLIPILEREDGTPASVSQEAMQASWDEYESKAKFALVAQRYTWEGEKLAPTSPEANCAVLGVFSTEKAALTAGRSAAMAFKGKTAAMWWVLPLYFDTPFAWHKDTKDELEGQVEERTYVASPATPIPCSAWFMSGNALHICTLEERHEGEHETGTPLPDFDPDEPFTTRRRLVQPDIDLEEDEDEEES